jgi:ADP-ribose pyrophosphatase YjhB (NUDIX family)
MELKKILLEKSQEAWENYLPSISIDCVVFGFHDAALKVLVLKLKEKTLWGLPGGFINKRENLDEAAGRILKNRCGKYLSKSV